MTVALLVATDQLRVIEVVTGVHAHRRWQASPHRNLAVGIEQRNFDTVDFRGMTLDDAETGHHRGIKILVAPVAGQCRIKHITEPMQDDRL